MLIKKKKNYNYVVFSYDSNYACHLIELIFKIKCCIISLKYVLEYIIMRNKNKIGKVLNEYWL